MINGYSHVGVQGSVRGRVGYAFDPVPLYVTCGLNIASSQNKFSSIYGATKQNVIFVGPTLGVGLKYAVNDRWNENVEARTAMTGNFGRTTPVWTPLVSVRLLSAEGLITAGDSYRFGY